MEKAASLAPPWPTIIKPFKTPSLWTCSLAACFGPATNSTRMASPRRAMRPSRNNHRICFAPARLLHVHATVDGEHLAGDVGGSSAAQEGDCICHFFGLA